MTVVFYLEHRYYTTFTNLLKALQGLYKNNFCNIAHFRLDRSLLNEAIRECYKSISSNLFRMEYSRVNICIGSFGKCGNKINGRSISSTGIDLNQFGLSAHTTSYSTANQSFWKHNREATLHQQAINLRCLCYILTDVKINWSIRHSWMFLKLYAISLMSYAQMLDLTWAKKK